LPILFTIDNFANDFNELKEHIYQLAKNTSGGLRSYIDNTIKYLVDVGNNFEHKEKL
jgi:hypothetical protein